MASPDHTSSNSGHQRKKHKNPISKIVSSIRGRISKTKTASLNSAAPSRASTESHSNSPSTFPEGHTPMESNAREGTSEVGGANRASNIGGRAVEWVLPVLKVVKEASAAFPPLQSAVGAIASVLDVAQVHLYFNHSFVNRSLTASNCNFCTKIEIFV